jgi:hypothetical protein
LGSIPYDASSNTHEFDHRANIEEYSPRLTDLRAMSARVGAEISGILGGSFMQKYVVTLDYMTGRIDLALHK